MKKITINRKAVPLLLFLLMACSSYAQLPAFTLTAISSPQTCTGNGSISFSVSGINPAAQMDYSLFLLPNTTTPITTVTAGPIQSVTAGNYLLIATQSFGGNSNTSSTNITVDNQAVLLEYQLVPTAVRCGNDGKITVNVTQGTAVSYEIMSGPVTVAPQASNVFHNLPVGTYQVRVHDNCEDALVITIQLQALTPLVVIGPGAAQIGLLPSCNTMEVRHNISTNTSSAIFYPLTLQYTVFPPGGGTPVVTTYTMTDGGPGIPSFPVFNDIPFYNGQSYLYNLAVTDACGNVFIRNNNQVQQSFNIVATPGLGNCTDNLFTIFPLNFVGPYTVNFVSAPVGFVPETFSAQHPTFTDSSAIYALAGTTVPEGSYTVQVTDACGRIATKSFTVQDPDITPMVTTEGCSGEGSITIKFTNRDIVSIEMINAPDGYPVPLPQDVSANINADGFEMGGLMLGEYTFELVDSCGETHIVEVELEPEAIVPVLQVLQRPGCEEDYGSVRIRNLSGGMTGITITAAPVAFAETLPYNVTTNIAGNGMFYMDNLPEGIYSISITDECGAVSQDTFNVEGLEVTANAITIVENCGSFDLDMEHTSNGNYLDDFWLQAYDEETGTWGHPLTGAPYTEGSMPTEATSIYILNNSNNISLAYTGTLRIMKVTYTYSSGSAANKLCVSEIFSFEFSGRPIIENAYAFPCANGLTEVAIEATGLAPLTYMITTMNGDPFVVENETSNIFTGLEPAIYNFRVTDVCSSFSNIEFNINELDPVLIETSGLCEGEQGLLSVPQFSFLDYEWTEAGAPDTVLSAGNTLSLAPFNSAIHPGTYTVRIFSASPTSCINQNITVVIAPNELPNAGSDNAVITCNDGSELDLRAYLADGQDGDGTWTDMSSTNALEGSMLNTGVLAEGIYQFAYQVVGDCGLTDDAVIAIELRARPDAPMTTPVAPVCEGSSIQLMANPIPNAIYSWTGPQNFVSAEQNPVLASAAVTATGEYHVTVTVNGCVSAPSGVHVTVNAIPQFTVSGNSSLCEGQTGELAVVPVNFNPASVNYTWYLNDAVLNNVDAPSISIMETGTYKVLVNNNNCVTPQQITVMPNTAAFDVMLEDGCVDFEYMITVTEPQELPESAYVWSGPNGYSAIGREVNISNLSEGTYTVNVLNSEGCTASASVDVENTLCTIPKGISPGDAEYNNSFDLSNLDVRHIKIFNRYGMEVYERENYINEWEGQSDKGELPSGTYYYVVSLSTGKKVTGWVYLQREN